MGGKDIKEGARSRKKIVDNLSNPGFLRQRAEDFLSRKPEALRKMPMEDIQKIVHELQVHQVELEMQNEELRNAQTEIEESRSRYADLYDFAPVGYLTLSIKGGVILEANLTAADLLGVPRNSLIKLVFSQFVMPEFLDPYLDHKKRVSEMDGRHTCELKLKKKDGTPFWALLDSIAVKDSSGNLTRIRTVVSDIADRKATEEERLRLAAAVEQAGEAIVITDTQGLIVYVNPIFEQTSGYGKKELLNKDYFEIFAMDGTDKDLKERAQQAMRQGETFSGHTRRRREGGRSLELDISLFSIRDPSGAIINYIILEKDVTTEYMLQEHLRHRQKMEALGTLAGGIAHDFNNILNPIFINTELALLDVPEPTRSSLKMALEAAHRGKELVKQIITFSRQKEQAQKLIKVGPLIREAIKFIRSSLPANIEIRDHIPVDTVPILADSAQIHQVIMNLCSNAAYAMREHGGVLAVTLGEVEVDSTLLARYPDLKPGLYLRLAVSDTGTGMEQEVKERAFDPFFTTKEQGEGAGMGLAVVHGIVKKHGGAVTVYSEVGKGSTFSIYFPVPEGESSPKNVDLTPIPRGKERILIVEDEKAQAISEQNMLERLGYKVTVANTAPEALKTFRENPEDFDLVITDQTMPQLTGADLAKALLLIRPSVPIILCTGFSEVINAEKAKSIGIRETVMKPFSMREMATTIRRVLDQ